MKTEVINCDLCKEPITISDALFANFSSPYQYSTKRIDICPSCMAKLGLKGRDEAEASSERKLLDAIYDIIDESIEEMMNK